MHGLGLLPGYMQVSGGCPGKCSVLVKRGARATLPACSALCARRLAPLSEGRMEGDELMCSYHGCVRAAGLSGACVLAARVRVGGVRVGSRHMRVLGAGVSGVGAFGAQAFRVRTLVRAR